MRTVNKQRLADESGNAPDVLDELLAALRVEVIDGSGNQITQFPVTQVTSPWVISGTVDTELGAAVTAADGMSNPTAPWMLALQMAWNGTTVDRALSYNLTNGASSGGTYLVPGVVPLKRAAGAPVENFTTSDPGVIRTVQHTTFADAFTDGGVGWDVTMAPGACYNALAGTWYFNRSAQQTYASAGLDRLGIPVAAMTAQYDDTSTDTPAENTFHHPRITLNRALHGNKRDASGNEIQESTEATLLASASRTTTQTGADITNYSGFKFLHITLDMTVVGTGSVTLEVQGKDVASGKYYAILTGAAVTTNSTNVYKVGPALPVTANVSTSDVLPRVWRVVVTANNANAATYSVGYSLIK